MSVLAAACLVACSGKGKSASAPCVKDDVEPNDTYDTAAFVGEIQDDPTPGSSTPTEVHHDVSLDTDTDVDWYRVTVHDTGAGGDPIVRVMVGDGMEATVWFQCGTGSAVTTVCQLGSSVDGDPDYTGKGCLTVESNGAPAQLTMTTDCANTDTDDGDAIVRVKRTSNADACASYRLSVSAE